MRALNSIVYPKTKILSSFAQTSLTAKHIRYFLIYIFFFFHTMKVDDSNAVFGPQ